MSPFQFERKWLLLCEGESDKTVFDRLIGRNADLTGLFQTRFPDRGTDGTGGRSKFGKFLSAAYEAQSFRDNVQAVLIVSDNDVVPADSFAEVQAQLQQAGGFGVPDAVQQVVRTPNFPAVVILMIPIGQSGNLETLCTEPLYSKWAVKNHVDQFIADTPANALTISHKSKAELQSLFAATCATRPDTNLSYHWREPNQYHVPLEHLVFQPISDFLSGFEALLEDGA